MGFPIKKRIASDVSDEVGPAPCGLDLLSAAVDSRLVESAARSSSAGSLEGSVVSQSSRTASPEACGDGEPSARPPAKSSSRSKRAPTFPEILLDILDDPACSSIVSWLPDGRSFAVLDMAEFSSYVLPKYFRNRVIFRSFARKLNRWGFRTVKRGTSGNVGPTFEHECFKRGSPVLVARMYCKSNPSASKVAAAAPAVHRAAPIAKGGIPREEESQSVGVHAARPIVTPSGGVSPVASAAAVPAAAAPVPRAAPVAPIAHASTPSRDDDEILARLQSELLLREMDHRRQQEALAVQELVRQRQSESRMEASTDMALQHAAVILRRRVLQQQQLGGQLGGEYGVAARFW